MEAVLSTILNASQVIIGLGLVIFVHELGHFLVAKWCGVKVEMFALGFGPALLSFRKGLGARLGSSQKAYQARLHQQAEASGEGTPTTTPLGETEYSIRAIPLGGFVKMLGEGDEAEQEATRSTDPRAYPNKSVPARMAIISAGVIMNVIFGLICFAFCFGIGGIPVIPARVGGLVPGQPAFEAGLQTGDMILSIDGRTDLDYKTLIQLTAMSSAEQVLHMKVRRQGVAEPIAINVQPRRTAGSDMKKMGIFQPESLKLSILPFLRPPGMTETPRNIDGLRQDAKVVAVGPVGATPQEVASVEQFREILSQRRDERLAVVSEPGPTPAGEPATPGGPVVVELPPAHYVDLGMRLTIGAISSFRPESPALAAGLKLGDRIVAVQGIDELDPMRLPDQLADRAGEAVTLTVARSEVAKPEEMIEVTLTPTDHRNWIDLVVGNEPVYLAALGFTYEVNPTVSGVVPGSPADRAGIASGDTIQRISVTPPEDLPGASGKITLSFDDESNSWAAAFFTLQQMPLTEVSLQTSRKETPIDIRPEPVADWYLPYRGLQFQIDFEPLAPMGFMAAIRRGLFDTGETIQNVYGMFRGLITGQISTRALGGPIMIFRVASQAAEAGIVPFLHILGMLSLNLAVINFLPIPPLDGGQMVYLLGEAIRGRPLPERVVGTGMILGLVLVAGLMLLVFYQDILNLF